MIRIVLAAALLGAAPVTASAQAVADTPPPLPQFSLQDRMLLRCSAAFALVANRQAAGDAKANSYPPLAQRGREFFVHATAQVIDETGLSDQQLAAALHAQAQELLDGDQLDTVMPVCLRLMDDSGY